MSETEPSTVAPSRNCTVPFGTPGAAATVATSVMVSVVRAGFGQEVSVTVDAALATVTTTAGEVLAP